MTLHIVSVSPWSGPGFAQCLRVLAPGDALLLIGDGVNALLPGTAPATSLAAQPADVGLYAHATDCAQRGIETLSDRVQRIDDAGFVALACAQPRSMSWF